MDSKEQVNSACEDVYIYSNPESGFTVGIKPAEGKKCARCWFYDDQVGNIDLAHDDICERCNDAITTWETETNQIFEKAVEEQPVS